ncbi:MAG: ShlB/FhaC/HecB family hemolysin secretion/activation protein [Gammaproteobacteria bacterium]
MTKNPACSIACALLVGFDLGGNAAWAQLPQVPEVPFAPERPGEDRRDRLPEHPLEKPSPLPPLTPPPEPKAAPLSTQLQVSAKKIKLTGNRVISNEELGKVTAPYENRTLSTEDLQSLRQALTVYYVNKGYINSGAVIPDQEVKDGVIAIQIVEGKLTDIELSGNEWLRDSYIAKRLRLGNEEALNLHVLQEHMQLLDQDRRIERLNAQLNPGLQAGEGVLQVLVEEARPYELGVSFNNYYSTSVGELRGEVYAAHYNLTGFGDVLSARYGITEGVDDLGASYSFPLTARDTRLNLYFDRSDADIVEEPFDRIDIASETETYGVSLSHPFFRTPRRQLLAELVFERRRSETFIFKGTPFELSFPFYLQPFPDADIDGETEVSVIRVRQEWVDRSPNQVLALRSTLSFGLDALGATENPGDLPGGEFFAWLGQVQWVRRLWETDNQVLIRGQVQWAADPLLPLEKLGVGGASTVRGYRENLLVRDRGFVGSIEFRFPVLRLPLPFITKEPEDGQVQLASFYDFGWSENVEESSPNPRTISSAGLGLRWDPHPKIHSELYWGFAFRDVNADEEGLQDNGIHFALDVGLF